MSETLFSLGPGVQWCPATQYHTALGTYAETFGGKGLLGRVWASGGLQKQQGESEESFVRRNSPAFVGLEPQSDQHLNSST